MTNAPLVVLLHGWGESEKDMMTLVPSLPAEFTYASLRAPYLAEGKHVWFKKGFPLDDTVAWFERWLDCVAAATGQVVLVGFSAGAAFAGGALLINPRRYAGAAILHGTLPFFAGLLTPTYRLEGTHVLLAQSPNDGVISAELQDRTWSYLTDGSGAIVEAVFYEGGHKISHEEAAVLSRWIREIVVG